jgi:hypothetical protein
MSNARSKSQKSTPSREPPRKSMSSPATLRSPARSPRRPAGGRDVGDIDPLEREESTASKSDIDGDSDPAAELERTVQRLFQEEENLLNLHMSIIQVCLYLFYLVYLFRFSILTVNYLFRTALGKCRTLDGRGATASNCSRRRCRRL